MTQSGICVAAHSKCIKLRLYRESCKILNIMGLRCSSAKSLRGGFHGDDIALLKAFLLPLCPEIFMLQIWSGCNLLASQREAAALKVSLCMQAKGDSLTTVTLKRRITEQPPAPLQACAEGSNKPVNQNDSELTEYPHLQPFQVGFPLDCTKNILFYLGCVWKSPSSATLATAKVGGCSEGTLLEHSLKWQSGNPKCPCSSNSCARSKAAACLRWRANSFPHSISALWADCFYGNNRLLSRSSVLLTTKTIIAHSFTSSLSPSVSPGSSQCSFSAPSTLRLCSCLMEGNVNAGAQPCCTRSVKSSLETTGTSVFMQLQLSTG